MATLITVTSYSKLANQDTTGLTTSPLVINTSRIISVSTRATPYNTNGITNVLYALPVNQATYQVNLVVTEAASAIQTAANAAAV